MRPLRVFDLDARGADYVCSRLTGLSEWGGPVNTLCAALRETIRSAAGRIWTMAPPETSSDRLYQFEWGGLLPENLDMSRAVDAGGGTLLAIESLFEEERTLFARLLRERSGRAGVLADPNAMRGDPMLSTFSRTAVYAGDQVFHVVDAASDDEIIDLALSAAPFWARMWMVASAPPKIDARRETSEEDLRRCAADALAVSLSAYDGEGFVVWQRAD